MQVRLQHSGLAAEVWWEMQGLRQQVVSNPHGRCVWMTIWATSQVRKGHIGKNLMMLRVNQQVRATAAMFAEKVQGHTQVPCCLSWHHLSNVSSDGQVSVWTFPPKEHSPDSHSEITVNECKCKLCQFEL